MNSTNWSRRKFLKFIGASTALGAASCSHTSKTSNDPSKVKGLKLNSQGDKVLLTEGLEYKILLKEADSIGHNLTFGCNNDYTHFYDFKNGRYGLWVNHESLSPLLLHDRKKNIPPTRKELHHERDQVGGSFVEIKQDDMGNWTPVMNSPLNFKVSGNTTIPLSRPLGKSTKALGTLANCSGGYTPWGTILTCEENYSHFYGELEFNKERARSIKFQEYGFSWTSVDPKPPEHYGWVVEVDPRTKKSEKLISLGRFSHECATVALSKDGYPVVYTGDDSANECLYKFVSSKKDSLKEGTLYVAHFDQGKWLPLDYNKSKLLQKHFKSQTEVLIHTREAARLLRGSLLDRPEDIDIDPVTGDVFVTLTNNKKAGNFHGSIIKLTEEDKGGTTFKAETFKAGGTKSGFSCPDNMAFDRNGNLWITSDISGGSLGSLKYSSFGNNGLFLVPRTGPQAGKVLKVASAPNEAEFTGPSFSPDQRTLFLSVQHPGEEGGGSGRYSSNWPSGVKGQRPLSCVITLTGELLNSFTQDRGV